MRGTGIMMTAFLALLAASGGRALALDKEHRRDAAPYTEALNLLEASGNINFTGFSTFGDSFEAMVTRKGKRVMLMVDPRHHRIMVMQ